MPDHESPPAEPEFPFQDEPQADSGRNEKGQFKKGNKVGRHSGLYVRVTLKPWEKKRCQRMAKRLRNGGIPDDEAKYLALMWVNASRVVEAYTELETHADRLAHFGVYARACNMILRVMAARLPSKRARRKEDESEKDKRLRRLIARTREASGEFLGDGEED
jgi:hypothetical protein